MSRSHYTIKTYRELTQWAEAFAMGDKDSTRVIHSLIVSGHAGVGKSETLKRVLAKEYFIEIKGKLTPFELFNRICAHVDALFLLDDTRQILKQPDCVNLLMQLSEHRSPKRVQWNSSRVQADDDGERQTEVETNSRLCLILNRVEEDNLDLEPIFSRSHHCRFEPSKTEVHNYVGTWFPKCPASKEIYQFIGDHLGEIPSADIRDYTKSLSIYSQLDWKAQLMQSWVADPAITDLMNILKDPTIKGYAARIEAFKARTGQSQAQMYKLQRLLQPLH